MNRHRIRRLRSIVLRRLALGIAAAVGLSLSATATGASASAHVSDKLTGADSSWYAVSESTDGSGKTVDTWRSPTGGTVVASGPPGLEVQILAGRAVKGRGQRVDHQKGFALKSPPFQKPQGTAMRGGTAATGMRLLNSLYATKCISYSSPDGQVYFYGCDNQYLDWSNGGGDWYMTDKQQISGRATSARYFWMDHLTSLDSYVSYYGGNQLTQWNPVSTISVGNCTTVTVGLTSNQTGINYSQSQQVCPNHIGPYVINATQFGTIWQGYESFNYEWEGTEGVDEVHSPPSASAYDTYYGYVNWCNYC